MATIRDPSSFDNPDEARVTHTDLEIDDLPPAEKDAAEKAERAKVAALPDPPAGPTYPPPAATPTIVQRVFEATCEKLKWDPTRGVNFWGLASDQEGNKEKEAEDK